MVRVFKKERVKYSLLKIPAVGIVISFSLQSLPAFALINLENNLREGVTSPSPIRMVMPITLERSVSATVLEQVQQNLEFGFLPEYKKISRKKPLRSNILHTQLEIHHHYHNFTLLSFVLFYHLSLRI